MGKVKFEIIERENGGDVVFLGIATDEATKSQLSTCMVRVPKLALDSEINPDASELKRHLRAAVERVTRAQVGTRGAPPRTMA